MIVRLEPRDRPTHLYWRFDRRRFVTLCEDGKVILDGRVTTLKEATERMLSESGVPVLFFWEK